jgi:diaminohydroxyphosphoribosylaminopyrimidine deaminase/5-amino-6-(5-phosphoribosylamino)uracil reductase
MKTATPSPSASISTQDHVHMQQALRLGLEGLGRVAPNPSVGAVVVDNNEVVGLGRTSDGGRPHAEVIALQIAGERARGATLYVTLEPCAHEGKSPPCSLAIIKAGIARVVVGCDDPFHAVNGRGIQQLQDAAIQVDRVGGELAGQCAQSHAGFFSTIQRKRPWVTLKIASSADGFIAPEDGIQQWITSPASRHHGHLLRYRHDAILTGIGTALADDPSLTCRLPGLEAHSPRRILLDRQNRLPADAKLLTDDGPALWHITEDIALEKLLENFAAQGITRLLVEAGNRLNTAFLQAKLVDEIYWYRAPVHLRKGLAAYDGEYGMKAIRSKPIRGDQLTVFGDFSAQILQ